MLRILVLASGVLLAAGAARADEAERLAMAGQIYDIGHSPAIEMQVFDATLPFYLHALDQTMNLTEAERASMPSVLRQVFLADAPTMRQHAVELYARTFSEAELQGMLDFYRSEAGRAFLAHQSDLNQDYFHMQDALNAHVVSQAAEQLTAQRTRQTP